MASVCSGVIVGALMTSGGFGSACGACAASVDEDSAHELVASSRVASSILIVISIT